MSPQAVAIALEAVRGELVEAQHWHAAAQQNLETADELHEKAEAAMRDAGVRVFEIERAIEELEQLLPEPAGEEPLVVDVAGETFHEVEG